MSERYGKFVYAFGDCSWQGAYETREAAVRHAAEAHGLLEQGLGVWTAQVTRLDPAKVAREAISGDTLVDAINEALPLTEDDGLTPAAVAERQLEDRVQSAIAGWLAEHCPAIEDHEHLFFHIPSQVRAIVTGEGATG